MENKSCGKCRFLEGAKIIGFCVKQGMPLCPSELPSCSKFEQRVVTNGDRVRQMSNEELAEIISNVDCKICPACMTCFKEENETCFDGMLTWLNAPADCVKQIENHDTQTDLCCNDDTQCEVNNG